MVLYSIMLTLVMSIIAVVSDPKLELADSQSMELIGTHFSLVLPSTVIEHTAYVLYRSVKKQEMKLMFNK